MDGIQGAILGVKAGQPRGLDEQAAQSRVVRRDARRDSVRLPAARPGCRHVYHVFAVRTDDRDRLREALTAQGIHTGIHYPIPIHLQPAHADRAITRATFQSRRPSRVRCCRFRCSGNDREQVATASPQSHGHASDAHSTMASSDSRVVRAIHGLKPVERDADEELSLSDELRRTHSREHSRSSRRATRWATASRISGCGVRSGAR